jgi:AraC family transcriptional regulator of adaptative response / DNA-3-methyladenine glycosylase II
LRLIANGALDDGGVEQLADRLGVTSRHLRRLFTQHIGASPLAVAHTQRLHFAKRLIDETALPLNNIYVAAGYRSIRRFNDTFKKTYGRSPRELRKLGGEIGDAGRKATLSVRLSYRQPFSWQHLLEFFGPRMTPGVEAIVDDRYRRSLSIGGKHAVVEVYPDQKPSYLNLTLHSVDTPALFETVQQARDVFDLDAPVAEISSVLSSDPLLKKSLRKYRGIRVPGAWDGFELTIRAILGQQISVKAATTLAGRIAARYGEPLDHGAAGGGDLLYLFPTAERLSRARFNNIGLVRSRADTLQRVAMAVVRGDLQFDAANDPDEFCTALQSIKGIGDWTAQYVMMRALKNPDAFPASDLGLLKALRYPDRVSPNELLRHAERWRPWRAYAALLLWSSLPGSGG